MKTSIFACVAGLLLLTGCSNEVAPSPTVTVTETVTAAPSEPSPTVSAEEGTATEERYLSHGTSDRGNIIKKIGDWAGIDASVSGDTVAVDFRITGIELDPKCDSGFVEKPKNGQFVKIDIEVESYPELKELGSFSITNFDFKVFDADGNRVNDPQGSGYSCLSSKASLPSSIGPAEKSKGSIVLDVPKNSSVFVYSNYLTNGGWEWVIADGDSV